MSLLLLQVSGISATGDIQRQDETAKAVQRLYFYVWYYVLLYLSDQKFVLLVWKGLMHLSTFYFFQVNHSLSGMCFALSSNFSQHANL